MTRMKDQAVVGNIGHFDNEIDMAGLARVEGIERINIKPQVDQWRFADGHSVIVPLRGQAVEPRQRNRPPSFVMSNSFTNQTIARSSCSGRTRSTRRGCTCCRSTSTRRLRRLHLDALAVHLTKLSPEQAEYIGVPVEGPFKPDHYRY